MEYFKDLFMIGGILLTLSSIISILPVLFLLPNGLRYLYAKNYSRQRNILLLGVLGFSISLMITVPLLLLVPGSLMEFLTLNGVYSISAAINTILISLWFDNRKIARENHSQ